MDKGEGRIRQRAFTLVELLVTIAIIVVLAALTVISIALPTTFMRWNCSPHCACAVMCRGNGRFRPPWEGFRAFEIWSLPEGGCFRRGRQLSSA